MQSHIRQTEKRPCRRGLAVLLVIGLILVATPVCATNHQVPTGFSTITAAIAATSPGDTISVSPGTYSPSTNGETFPITVTKENIFILGSGSDVTIIDAESDTSVVYWDNNSSGRITGFQITGGRAKNGGGIDIRGGNPEVDRNFIHHNQAISRGAAIYVVSDASPWFHHNVIWENTDYIPTDTSDPHGVILTGTTQSIFEHNLVGRTDGNGILTSNMADPIIRHNLLIENGRTEPTRRGRGICTFSGVVEPRIYHNLFWDNEVAALLTGIGGANVSAVVANDLFPDDFIFGNIDADPMHVDPDNFDFHLLSGSEAIDAGLDTLPGDPDGTVADLGPIFFDQSTSAVLPSVSLVGPAMGNAPNPFNPMTEIWFELEDSMDVRLWVVDAAGRLVREVYSGRAKEGRNRFNWDGRDAGGRSVASGIYFTHLETPVGLTTRGLTLIR